MENPVMHGHAVRCRLPPPTEAGIAHVAGKLDRAVGGVVEAVAAALVLVEMVILGRA
jgi:hypothetical protein